jgi:hypothetical protein
MEFWEEKYCLENWSRDSPFTDKPMCIVSIRLNAAELYDKITGGVIFQWQCCEQDDNAVKPW